VTFRWLLARLHWWSGLVAMPVLLCVALSGALLAISPWLLAAATPRARDVRATPLPESTLLARVSRDLPPGDAVGSIEWGGRDRAQLLTLRSGERWFVDPVDGSVLEKWRGETPLEHAIGVAHDFHVRLLAGQAGHWLVDLAAIVVLFSAVSGLYLWWKTKRLRIARAARGRRWWRDLHDVTGLYASLVIVALALSGVLLAWEEPLYWLAGAQPVREPALPHSHSPAPGAPDDVGVDQWLAAASRALPGLPPIKLSLPATERSPVAVQFGRSGRPGRSTVWLDRWDGRVLRVDDFLAAPRAYRAHVLDRAVHTGDLVGAPSVLIALLGTLALAVLAATSLVTWLLRTPAAARRASRTHEG
jgi:uncharacterized iron-regulated membrane protein